MDARHAPALAWIALVVAVLGTVLAWGAYNRAGQEAQQQVTQAILREREQNQQQEIARARAQARGHLENARIALQEQRAEDAVASVRIARSTLEAVYEDAQEEALAEWGILQEKFGILFAQLEGESEFSLESLEQLILSF